MKQALPFLCFVIALGLGWIVTPSTIAKPEVESSLSTRTLRESSSKSKSQDREQLREINDLKTHEEKVFEVLALASSIPIEKIAEWHRSNFVRNLDDELQDLFLRITSERWLEVNPREFMEWATMMNYRQSNLHLAQWAVKDPGAASEFIASLPRSTRMNQICQIIPVIAKTNPDLALEFLSGHLSSLSSQDDYYLRSALNSLAEKNLEGLLKARSSWPKAARDQASTAIAGVFFEEDFAKGLSFMENEGLDWIAIARFLDRKTAESFIENRGRLPEGILSKMLQRSPWQLLSASNGLELLEGSPESLGLDSQSFSRMLSYAGNIPMTEENRGRLMAVINGETLSLENRKSILQNRVTNWDRADSEGLREWLGTLDDPDLHATADQVLTAYDNQTDAKPTFEGDIAKLVEPGRLDYNTFRRMNRWTPAETGKALEAFRNFSIEEQQASFKAIREGMSYGANNFDFYQEIFTEASNFPPSDEENSREQVEHTLSFQSFSYRFAQEEPAKAAAWASQLAPGDARLNAINSVAKAWNQYSPTEAEAWIDSLPAAEQEAARKTLEPH